MTVLTNIKAVAMSLWTSRLCPEKPWKVAFFAFLPSGCNAKNVQAILLERKAIKSEGERERERETSKFEALHGQ